MAVTDVELAVVIRILELVHEALLKDVILSKRQVALVRITCILS